MEMLPQGALCENDFTEGYMSLVHFNRVILEERDKHSKRNVYIARGDFSKNVVISWRSFARAMGKRSDFSEVVWFGLNVMFAYVRPKSVFSVSHTQSGASVRTH